MSLICPKCGGVKIVKNGFRKGGQCYKCKECDRQFTLKQNKYSPELKYIVCLLCKRKQQYRLIAKIFEIKSISLISCWTKMHKANSKINEQKGEEKYDSEVIKIILSNAKTRIKRIKSELNAPIKTENHYTRANLIYLPSDFQRQKQNKEVADKRAKVENEWSKILNAELKLEDIKEVITQFAKCLNSIIRKV